MNEQFPRQLMSSINAEHEACFEPCSTVQAIPETCLAQTRSHLVALFATGLWPVEH